MRDAGTGPVSWARRTRRSWIIRECLIVTFGFVLYVLVRGIVEGERQTALDHAARGLRFEQRAWFFVEPDIQAWAMGSGLALDLLGVLWFVLALPSLALACLWLMARAPAVYLRLRNALGISTLLVLLVYWLFPTAPPSALPESGVRDVPSLRGWPEPGVNDYAAMPSAQAGWVLAIGVAVVVAARRSRWRWLVWVGVASVLASGIITGQHLILDLLVGALISLTVLGIVWHQARFRAWWSEWMVPDPNGPTMIVALRRDRWAALTVLSLGALTVYLIAGRALDPGFTDYWFYMMAQILATIVAVVWLTHRFGPEKGLHPITLVIVVLVTYLDTLGTAANLYARFEIYDKITHTGGGAILGAAFYDLVASLRQRGAIGWRVSRQVSFAILLSVLLGAMWELYEFAGDAIFHTGRHSGRIDTLYDLISDSAGAILAVLLLAWAFQRSSPSAPSHVASSPEAAGTREETTGTSRHGARFAALCGVLAPLVLMLTVLVGGWLNPGYSHARGTISDLWEQGRDHAEFVSAGLVLAGLLIILFSAGLLHAMPGRHLDVSLAVALYGVAIVGAGIFQDYASRPGRVLNLEGFLHNTWSWIAVGSLALCVLIVFWHASRESAWRPLLVSSGLVLLVVAVTAATFAAAQPGSGWRGLSERLLFGSGCAWMLSVARTAARLHRSPGRHTGPEAVASADPW